MEHTHQSDQKNVSIIVLAAWYTSLYMYTIGALCGHPYEVNQVSYQREVILQQGG